MKEDLKIKEKKQRSEPGIEALLDYANRIIATQRELFLVLEQNLKVVSTHQAFYAVFEVMEKETIG